MNILNSLPKSRIFIPLFVPFRAAHPGISALSAPISGAYFLCTTLYCLTPAALSPEINNAQLLAQPSQPPYTYTSQLPASTVCVLRDNNPNIPDFTVEPAISYYFLATSLSLNPIEKLTINKNTNPTGAPCYWFDCVALKTSTTMTDKRTKAFTSAIHPTGFL